MKRERNRVDKGFTLIEALGASVILGIGIAAAISGFTALGKGEARARDVETMHRLAVQKYDELCATTSPFTGSQNGDFTDRGDTTHTWSLTVQPSGVQNLDAIIVTVQKTNANPGDPAAEVDGLVNEPPQTSTTAAGGG